MPDASSRYKIKVYVTALLHVSFPEINALNVRKVMQSPCAPDVMREPFGLKPSSCTMVIAITKHKFVTLANVFIPQPLNQIKLNTFKVIVSPYNIPETRIRIVPIQSAPESYLAFQDYPHIQKISISIIDYIIKKIVLKTRANARQPSKKELSI